MAGPLGGDTRAKSAHHLMLKISMSGPLGVDAGARECPPPYAEDVYGGPFP
jgi:hypothetical protein